MLRRQRRRRDRDDADALARRQRRLHPGHLHQRGGRDRHADGGRKLALEQREEAAIGGNRLGAEPDEIARRLDEIRQQPGRTLEHHLLGAGAADHTIQHRERPGRAIAHIAGNPRKPRLQHQDTQRNAVDRLPATRDPRRLGRCENIGHHLSRLPVHRHASRRIDAPSPDSMSAWTKMKRNFIDFGQNSRCCHCLVVFASP